MALPQGSRVTGQRHITPVLASATIIAGDLLQTTEATGSSTVAAAATGKAIFGVAIQGIASAAVGLADAFYPGDQFWVKIITGTMAAASVGKFADLTGALGATGITLTNSNNDFRIDGWDGVTTNYCFGHFPLTEQNSVAN